MYELINLVFNESIEGRPNASSNDAMLTAVNASSLF